MNAGWLVFSTLVLTAHPTPPPGAGAGAPILDVRDHQALLLGATTVQEILEHRAIFRDNAAKMRVPGDLKARWQAIHTPLTLVAVFGSWCGDSQAYLPNLLTLAMESNPFIDIHFLGVNRDKQVAPSLWPTGCAPQAVTRVPTFYLFAVEPGGQQRLVGTIVEHPPHASQTMAAALLDLVEAGAAGH